MNLRSKRKNSFGDSNKKKKIRLSKRRNKTSLEHVINLGIPHVGEQIFQSISDDTLFQCLKVSETWKILAENVLAPKYKGKMYEACKTGKAEIVKLLLENYNSEENGLNATTFFTDFTPFTSACQQGHADVVKLLLQHSDGNFDLNAKSYGDTGFSWACTKGHKDVVNLLLNHSDGKIDLNAKNELGHTAFMHACSKGHSGVVRLMLKYYEAKGIEIPPNISGISDKIKGLIFTHQGNLQQVITSLDSVREKTVQLKRKIMKGEKKAKTSEENYRQLTKTAYTLVAEIDQLLVAKSRRTEALQVLITSLDSVREKTVQLKRQIMKGERKAKTSEESYRQLTKTAYTLVAEIDQILVAKPKLTNKRSTKNP